MIFFLFFCFLLKRTRIFLHVLFAAKIRIVERVDVLSIRDDRIQTDTSVFDFIFRSALSQIQPNHIRIARTMHL